jgi:hypothetical protein
MSILTDFANANMTEARSIIGGETIAIGGGTAISGVVNERSTSRDYETGGFQPNDALTVVVKSSEFVAAYPLDATAYHGKTAVVRSRNFRVDSVDAGQVATTISLVSVTEGA